MSKNLEKLHTVITIWHFRAVLVFLICMAWNTLSAQNSQTDATQLYFVDLQPAFFVTANTLNIRSEFSTNAPIIATASAGDVFRIVQDNGASQLCGGSQGICWWRIFIPEYGEGFIAGSQGQVSLGETGSHAFSREPLSTSAVGALRNALPQEITESVEALVMSGPHIAAVDASARVLLHWVWTDASQVDPSSVTENDGHWVDVTCEDTDSISQIVIPRQDTLEITLNDTFDTLTINGTSRDVISGSFRIDNQTQMLELGVHNVEAAYRRGNSSVALVTIAATLQCELFPVRGASIEDQPLQRELWVLSTITRLNGQEVRISFISFPRQTVPYEPELTLPDLLMQLTPGTTVVADIYFFGRQDLDQDGDIILSSETVEFLQNEGEFTGMVTNPDPERVYLLHLSAVTTPRQ